jgi:hypothetical protein
MDTLKLNKKLETDRSYGIVYGSDKVNFEQDGIHYSANGEVVEQWTTADKLANEAHIREKQRIKEAQLARQRAIAEQRKRLLEDR